MRKIISLLEKVNFRFILILYILFVFIATIQAVLLSQTVTPEDPYTHYNNYVIFKQSHFHLLEYKDLYTWYLDKQWDLYKYSPTFSLFFGVFSYLPDVIGLFLWNCCNALVLFFAVVKLPRFSEKTKCYILLFSLIELMTSLQNEQSNGLMAGLMILCFAFLEERKYFLAILFLFLSIQIKLFSVVFFALLIFYPQKWKLAAYSVACLIFYFVLPLLVVDFQQLGFLYSSWFDMLTHDHSVSIGYSVMGWLQTWFGIIVEKKIAMVVGAVLFCLPLLKIKKYKEYSFRLLMLASVLIWVVIFNHKAESPTFIIAISGVGIWFFSQTPQRINVALLIAAFIFTSLSPTDIFPKFIQNGFMKPYLLKAVPCILIWFKIFYELLFDKYVPDSSLKEQTTGSVVLS